MSNYYKSIQNPFFKPVFLQRAIEQQIIGISECGFRISECGDDSLIQKFTFRNLKSTFRNPKSTFRNRKKMLSKHRLNQFIFVICLLSPIRFRTLNHPLRFTEMERSFFELELGMKEFLRN
jgi:hypothetical protein